MDFHDRLHLLWKDTGDSGVRFSLNIGKSPDYITKCIQRKFKVTVETLNEIYAFYTDYNPCFVPFGIGKLKKEEVKHEEKNTFIKDFPAVFVSDKNGNLKDANIEFEKQIGVTIHKLKNKRAGHYLKRTDFNDATRLNIRAAKKKERYAEMSSAFKKLGLPFVDAIEVIRLSNGYIGFCNLLDLKLKKSKDSPYFK